MSGPPLLSVQNLKTIIRTEGAPIRAVDVARLDLQPGETFGLVGESGCGKTMLALSIGRLLPPGARIVEGKVLFEGTDLASLAEESLRKIRGGKIAYVFQDPLSSLNPVLSVGEQLREAIRLHQGGSEKAASRQAARLLEQAQIRFPERRLRQYPHQLSGGMRQRVMLAMALAGRPALLIADEPTTALDVTTQAEILRLLKKIQRESAMAILLITHDLSVAAAVCDRIGVMYAGRIVETAAAGELVQHPSHPYAQALLAGLPKVGQGRQRLATIGGAVPDLRFIPAGCPFHPRCPELFERCRQEEPQLRDLAPGRSVSCWKR